MDREFANYTPKKKMILWKYGQAETPEDKSIIIYNSNNQMTEQNNYVVEGNIITISGVGASVWELCTGSNTVEQIVQGIIEEYDADSEQVAKDVEAFLTDLDQRELIILDWSPL